MGVYTQQQNRGVISSLVLDIGLTTYSTSALSSPHNLHIGSAERMFPDMQGMAAFAWNYLLASDSIDSFPSSASRKSGNWTLSFATATVYEFREGENMPPVFMDNSGHD
ncbi:uncharacterized protein BDZ99DRAFT_515321 [Mytilinidion resinicola]|uniref:Uncharacterized protein n=1 Tax=Mytilinidion resinicola TaxID=574789 RepID=A0A6A6Z0B7_9PEZI|nr:uncharacterized protein BDZ99DRAFT_515321 [Mytilinidion resinicola]KAF2814531.1 hypothetical protein BDZ99DRAFT_515321 [Mytilinidion resinicola]